MVAAAPEDQSQSQDPADGLVFSYAFGTDGYATDDPAAAKWVWSHYGIADTRAKRSIETNQHLPENVRDALVASHGNAHFDFEEPWLHGQIIAARYEHDNDTPELSHFRFAARDDLLISCRKRPLRAIEEIRHIVGARKRPFPTPAALVEAVMVQALNQLVDESEKLAAALDAVEDHVIAGGWYEERKKLPELRREIVYLHRHASAMSSTFRHVEYVHHSDLPSDLSDSVARLSHHALALLHDTEQLQARARLLQDELMARLSDRSNQLLYLLSVLTAVLLPMTVLSGLLGMNVGGLPLTKSPYGFWDIVIASGVIAALVLFVVTRYGGRR